MLVGNIMSGFSGAAPAIGWNLGNSSYASKSLDVSGQMAALRGLAASADGTKVYVSNGTTDIYQYTLSAPWDLSTGSYASKTLNVSGTLSNAVSIAFSADGTKMYVGKGSVGTIYQFTLSTPWDVSTGVYASKSLDVSAQQTTVYGISLSSDGTKLYAAKSGGLVYQYTLGTPYDLSTGSYASKSLDPTSQDSNPNGGTISSDGLHYYIIGRINNTAYQYDLSSAWDISSGRAFLLMLRPQTRAA